jgi:hypothetical protein
MVTFGSLDYEELYCPMIARMHSQAFFGLPPDWLQPQGPRTVLPTPSGNASTDISHRIGLNFLKYEEQQGNVEDLYGASSLDGDDPLDEDGTSSEGGSSDECAASDEDGGNPERHS